MKIKYLFETTTDTLTGFSNELGNFTIDTKNKKGKKVKGKIKVIDDVEIWIVHFNKNGQNWTTNSFSSLSSEIECVIDDNAADEKMLRTTIYKIERDNLIFQSQIFSKDDPRPGQYLYGDFRLVKE